MISGVASLGATTGAASTFSGASAGAVTASSGSDTGGTSGAESSASAANIYCTARFTSSSLSSALPPRGGITFKPLMALLKSVSSPLAIRAAQPALSPNFGASSTPGV